MIPTNPQDSAEWRVYHQIPLFAKKSTAKDEPAEFVNQVRLSTAAARRILVVPASASTLHYSS